MKRFMHTPEHSTTRQRLLTPATFTFRTLLLMLVLGYFGCNKGDGSQSSEKPTKSISEIVSKEYDRNNMAPPKQHGYRVFVNDSGKVFIQQDQSIYLHFATESGENVPMHTLPRVGGQQAMHLDGPGEHTLRHDHDDDLPTDVFEINSDARPPRSNANFLDARQYQQDSTFFYGPNLKVSIEVTDDFSGVQESLVSIDGNEFIQDEATLAFDHEKIYSLRYYAVDNVGNVSEVSEHEFVVDLTPPKASHVFLNASVGEIISPQTQVKLEATDELAGVEKIMYKFDDAEAYQVYNGNALPLSSLQEGTHTISYYAIDQVGNESNPTEISIYFDETPPISNFSINGDQFEKDSRTYVSPRTKIQLSANDNKVQVETVEFEINGQGFQKYSEPFQIPQTTGMHTIKYRAQDDVKNLSEASTLTLWMDLTNPKSNYKFDGPTFLMRDTLYITTRTNVVLPSSDNDTGIQQVKYTLDTKAQKKFEKPFVVEGRGFHEVIYHAIDNVNNIESNQRVAFVVDDRAPEIFHHYSAQPYEEITHEGKRLGVYPKLLQLFLASTDDLSGTNAIYYSINGGAEQLFKDPIRGWAEGIYEIRIRSLDNVTNENTSTIQFAIGRF